MDEIARERRRLRRILRSKFGNSEDATFAKMIFMTAVHFHFGRPIKEEDRPHYLALLERLPKEAGDLRVFSVQMYDTDTVPHWRVIFTDNPTLHESFRRFPTEAAAHEYASHFLASWAEIRER